MNRKLHRMGQASALSRDERLFQLEQGIKLDKIKTVDAAVQYLHVSRTTVMSYLKSLNWSLYDPKTKQMTPIDTSLPHSITLPI